MSSFMFRKPRRIPITRSNQEEENGWGMFAWEETCKHARFWWCMEDANYFEVDIYWTVHHYN